MFPKVNRITKNHDRKGVKMEREQTTIRLPAELNKRLQQEAEAKKYAWYAIRGYVYSFIGLSSGLVIGLIISTFLG